MTDKTIVPPGDYSLILREKIHEAGGSADAWELLKPEDFEPLALLLTERAKLDDRRKFVNTLRTLELKEP